MERILKSIFIILPACLIGIPMGILTGNVFLGSILMILSGSLGYYLVNHHHN